MKLNFITNYNFGKVNTTIKVDCFSKYFCEINSIFELKEYLNFIKNTELNYFVIGSGSNILPVSEKYDGIILKLKLERSEIMNLPLDNMLNNGNIFYSASDLNSSISKNLFEIGYKNVAWLATIPGTLGGAIYGNSGFFGYEIGDYVHSVFVFEDDEIKIYSKEECEFGYRDSIFKRKDAIILGVSLVFPKTYGDENEENEENLLFQKMKLSRLKTQPIDKKTCGCVFKNIDFKNLNLEKVSAELKLSDREIDFLFSAKKKISTGFILDRLGFKNLHSESKRAMFSNIHAGFIVNCDKATSADILELVELAKNKVRNSLDVELECEVKLI